MGFLQNMSDKAANAANARMIDGLRENVMDLVCDQAEIMCANDPKFHHLGICLTAPSGNKYFFHRCMAMYWFVGKSESDPNPKQLVKMIPTDPTTHEPIIAAYVQLTESAPMMARYEALWEKYFNQIGMGVGINDDKISDHQSAALEAARPQGALREFRAGTSWVEGQEPENRVQAVIHKKIDGLEAWYAENFVSEDDIRSYWDKAPLEHALIFESSQILALCLYSAFLQTGAHDSEEAAFQHANDMYWKLAPAFTHSSKLAPESSEPDSKFPMELYERVVPKYLTIVEKKGIEGLEAAIGKHSSMSAFLRTEMAKGKF
jgi:hypothetical protein